MRTKDRLARELRLRAKVERNKTKAKAYNSLADRAETGEFDDYSNVHVCGPTALFNELMTLDLRKFAGRVLAGEFDASMEESEEWANSAEGREAMKDFTPEQRAELFGVYDA